MKEESLEQALERWRTQKALSLVMRLLNRRLGEDLLDFTTVADLQIWLQSHL